MAKVPRAGNVKTRLEPILSPKQCAGFSESLIEDAINKARNAANKLVIAFEPAPERAYFINLERENFALIEQKGSDLGEKMFNAFGFAFSVESDAVVLIGTDSPTFPADFIEQAFEFLETNSDAVLGKTEDGGFYLIGLRVLRKEIFENVPWGSNNAFDQVFQNIENLKLHLREVPGWYDVDEPEDFEQLKRELIINKNARRRAPKTFEWLIKENFLPPDAF